MDGNGGEGQPWPKGFVGKLSDPFPHRKAWNPVATRDDDDFDGDDGDDDPQWDPANMAGAFPICDHGCALRSWLVVSGRERGRVWYDGRADGDGVWPQVDADGKHLTFGNWYLTWIDESLSALRKAQRRKRYEPVVKTPDRARLSEQPRPQGERSAHTRRYVSDERRGGRGCAASLATGGF